MWKKKKDWLKFQYYHQKLKKFGFLELLFYFFENLVLFGFFWSENSCMSIMIFLSFVNSILLFIWIFKTEIILNKINLLYFSTETLFLIYLIILLIMKLTDFQNNLVPNIFYSIFQISYFIKIIHQIYIKKKINEFEFVKRYLKKRIYWKIDNTDPKMNIIKQKVERIMKS